jgi:hypothetical protein
VSGTTELIKSLNDTTEQLQQAEPELRAMTQEYTNCLKTGAAINIWQLLDNILVRYRQRVTLFNQQLTIATEYSERYNGFTGNHEKQQEFRAALRALAQTFRDSTAECNANLDRLKHNDMVCISSVKASMEMLARAEQAIAQQVTSLDVQSQVMSHQIASLLDAIAANASKSKSLREQSQRIAEEKLAIGRVDQENRNHIEALTATLKGKIADNELSVDATIAFGQAADLTLRSLDQTIASRKESLHRHKLSCALSKGSDVAHAYEIAGRARKSSEYENTRYQNELVRLDELKQELLLQGDFTGISDTTKQLKKVESRIAPCQERRDRYGAEEQAFSNDWDVCFEQVGDIATQLNCIQDRRPEDHGIKVITVAHDGATIRFEHPDKAIERDQEQRNILLEQLRSQRNAAQLHR